MPNLFFLCESVQGESHYQYHMNGLREVTKLCNARRIPYADGRTYLESSIAGRQGSRFVWVRVGINTEQNYNLERFDGLWEVVQTVLWTTLPCVITPRRARDTKRH